MLYPAPLKPGDRVAVVCVSTAVPDGRLEPAIEAVKAWGLEPVVYPSCSARHGYFSGTDAQRATDMNEAFADPTIAGVLAGRGGYGAHRILPLLDWDMIKQNPKPFFGYSDVTALHIAFQQAGFVSYHTIMPTTEYYQAIDDYSTDYLKKAFFGGLTGFIQNPEGVELETLVGGQATGRLCGGNLTLMAASLGTPWEIDTKDKIVFMEDIDEATYRVDGYLTQLRNAGKFEQCAGVVLGAWTNCLPERPESCLQLSEIFEELIAPAGKPMLGNLSCGHLLPTCALPLGGMVHLDADAKTLEVLP